MDGLTDADAALLGAAIASAATLVGALAAFMLQARLAKRQRQWAVEDAETQRQHELEVLQEQHAEARRRELHAERRVAYTALLSELLELETTVDYSHRLRRSALEIGDTPEEAAATAGRILGEFPHAEHYKRLQDLAAQVEMVCTDGVAKALSQVISAAMRAVASMRSDSGGEDLTAFRRARGALMPALFYDLRLHGYDLPYDDLLAQFGGSGTESDQHGASAPKARS